MYEPLLCTLSTAVRVGRTCRLLPVGRVPSTPTVTVTSTVTETRGSSRHSVEGNDARSPHQASSWAGSVSASNTRSGDAVISMRSTMRRVIVADPS